MHLSRFLRIALVLVFPSLCSAGVIYYSEGGPVLIDNTRVVAGGGGVYLCATTGGALNLIIGQQDSRVPAVVLDPIESQPESGEGADRSLELDDSDPLRHALLKVSFDPATGNGTLKIYEVDGENEILYLTATCTVPREVTSVTGTEYQGEETVYSTTLSNVTLSSNDSEHIAGVIHALASTSGSGVAFQLAVCPDTDQWAIVMAADDAAFGAFDTRVQDGWAANHLTTAAKNSLLADIASAETAYHGTPPGSSGATARAILVSIQDDLEYFYEEDELTSAALRDDLIADCQRLIDSIDLNGQYPVSEVLGDELEW